MITWPLAGLITEAVVPALLAAVAVVAIVVLRWRAPDADERLAVRWLGLGLLWTCGFLTVAAPSLAVVIPELPNDHYHAFADPMVVILVGLGAAAAWRAAPSAGRAGPAPGGAASEMVRPVLRGVAILGVGALCGWNLATQPPAVNPDGGFPAAADAGAQIVASTGGEAVQMLSLPDFKSVEAYAYPVVRLGRSVNGTALDILPGNLVIVCDARFEAAIGADCDGPAEDALAARERPDLALADRFEAAPGRFISIYLTSP